MDKILNKMEHEDLITANEKIEIAAKTLTVLDVSDFQSDTFPHDIGLIIQDGCNRIQSIIGTNDQYLENLEDAGSLTIKQNYEMHREHLARIMGS